MGILKTERETLLYTENLEFSHFHFLPEWISFLFPSFATKPEPKYVNTFHLYKKSKSVLTLTILRDAKSLAYFVIRLLEWTRVGSQLSDAIFREDCLQNFTRNTNDFTAKEREEAESWGWQTTWIFRTE